MAIFLALLTAASYGVGDFFGGMATKRARVLQVVAGSHILGAIGSFFLALLVADRIIGRDLLLGIGGGFFGMIGVALLYRRLAIGPMSVVAPLTAITSAVLPAAWGILQGERLTELGWVGIVFALVAVVLVSLSPDAPDADAPVTFAVIAESLLAGAGFGAIFIFFGATSDEGAPWPVVSARIFTATLLVITLVVLRRRNGAPVLPTDRGAWPYIAAAGLLDTGSNAMFIYASNRGQLAVVSVLAALYPITTVILARVVLGERMTRLQQCGFVTAMVATALLVLD